MEEKPRLIVYGFLASLISGLIYNVFFIIQGLLMDTPDMFGMLAQLGGMMGDMMGITDTMMLAMLGFMLHTIVTTIVFGGLFGILLIFLPGFINLIEITNRTKMTVFGLIFGIVIFMIGPMMMVPMMMGGTLFDLSVINMVGAVGHLVYGAILGYLFYFFDNKGYFK